MVFQDTQGWLGFIVRLAPIIIHFAHFQHIIHYLHRLHRNFYPASFNFKTEAPTLHMTKTPHPDKLKDRLSGTGLYWLSQIVYRTCKFQIVQLDRFLNAMNGDRPVIFTQWHGNGHTAVPMAKMYHPNFSNFATLLPDDWRGGSLRIWADKMGATSFPLKLTGDSTLGMARTVVRLTRQVMGGKTLYINPDGPDGPAHVIKPGILFIARKSNALIVPIGAYCRNAYIIPRWDRYTIPYPFSRITFHVGEPIDSLPDDNIAATNLVTNTLNRVTLQAAADYYEKS
jgi:lysophospholipid acyltransferase (LPLAT)-like uncharacterized protein